MSACVRMLHCLRRIKAEVRASDLPSRHSYLGQGLHTPTQSCHSYALFRPLVNSLESVVIPSTWDRCIDMYVCMFPDGTRNTGDDAMGGRQAVLLSRTQSNHHVYHQTTGRLHRPSQFIQKSCHSVKSEVCKGAKSASVREMMESVI